MQFLSKPYKWDKPLSESDSVTNIVLKGADEMNAKIKSSEVDED